MQDYQKGTQCIHAGYTPGNGEPRNIPIVQSTTFRYESSPGRGHGGHAHLFRPGGQLLRHL